MPIGAAATRTSSCFRRVYVGSEATGYAATRAFEDARAANSISPTAMAISGAAASSNMGANSITAAHADARASERPDSAIG